MEGAKKICWEWERRGAEGGSTNKSAPKTQYQGEYVSYGKLVDWEDGHGKQGKPGRINGSRGVKSDSTNKDGNNIATKSCSPSRI